MAVLVISAVVTPAAKAPLCSLDAVKRELRITGADADAYLGDLITSCSASVSRYLDLGGGPETVRDTILPDPESAPATAPATTAVLALSRAPIATVVTVREGAADLVPGRDVLVDPGAGRLIRLGPAGLPVPWSSAPIVVEFTVGEDIPADVADATLRLVKSRWFSRGRDPLLRSESIPGVRDASYWVAAGGEEGAFPPDVQSLLDAIRLPVIA